MADKIISEEHPIPNYIDFAERTLSYYALRTGGGKEFALRDLLADLMHWCDAREVDFDEEFQWAFQNYLTEVSDERIQSNLGD